MYPKGLGVLILSESAKINMAAIWLKKDSIKDNGIKYCYRADKRNTLLEPTYQIWMGSHLERLKDGLFIPKMKMVALFGRKLIISASILLRKVCLGLKFGYSRSRNPFMIRASCHCSNTYGS